MASSGRHLVFDGDRERSVTIDLIYLFKVTIDIKGADQVPSLLRKIFFQ